MNWACEKLFIESKNTKNSCLCHPGKWDYGYTGVSISQYMSQGDELMWKPHWTCCRKEWAEKGCTKMKHKGPFIENVNPEDRTYKWPDLRAQYFFKKKVSIHWKDKILKECPQDEHQLNHMFKKAEGELSYGGGNISIDQLPILCDKLKLNLLVNSPDISFQYKFQSVVNSSAGSIIDDGSGFIDKERY
jgi:hypothetical protein